MLKIEITDKAKENLRAIEDFLLEEWNIEVLLNFNQKFDKICDLIAEGNVVFQKYENTQYHKILITKHNTMIYKIEDDTLFIIRILQNFQDPEENAKSIP